MPHSISEIDDTPEGRRWGDDAGGVGGETTKLAGRREGKSMFGGQNPIPAWKR